MNLQRLFVLVRGSAVLLAVLGITTVYRDWLHVNRTTIALTFLILILLLAAKWGLRYALSASLLAAFCFNFYFLPPVGTLTVSDPQDWVALIAFVVAAVVGSRLSDRIQAEAADARARQSEMELLFRLSRALLQTDQVASLINLIPQAVADLTLASGVVLYLLESNKEYLALGPNSALLARADLRQLSQLSGIDLANAGVDGAVERAILPLRVGVRPRGVLLLANTRLSRATLEALSGLVSISIDRADALERATRSEASKENERLRSAMLDSITHELRTPLTSIKASATTLLHGEALNPEDRHELITVINEETDRLDRLVGEAVQMAQLDSREIQMHLSPQSVAGLIQAARNTAAQILAEHSVRVELPPDLPLALADPDWMEKVLSNLLDNAAKYSPPTSEIMVTARSIRDVLEISVSDHGSGIENLEQQLIFNKFYRVRGVHISGTGMGLAICKAILEEHGGTISVVSQIGQGSVFTVTLPAAPQTQRLLASVS